MRKVLNVGVLSAILLYFIILYCYSFDYHEYDIKIAIGLSFYATILYFRGGKKTSYGKVFLRPSLLLLLGLVIIIYQNPIDYILGNTTFNNDFFFATSSKNKVVLYGSIAYISYIIGYLIKDKPFKPINLVPQYTSIQPLVYISFALFILFLLSIDASFFSGEDYADSGSISGGSTNGWEFLLGMVNTAIISQYTINNNNNELNLKQYIGGYPKLYIVVFVLYILLRLVSGTRAPVLRAVLLMVFSFVFINRKQYIKNYIIIGCIVIGAVVFSVVSFSRGIIGTDFNAKYQQGVELLDNVDSVSPFTSELARSQSCDVAALEIFGSNKSFHTNGIIQLRYFITTFIPSRIVSVLWPTETKYLGSAYYITVNRLGANAKSGMGTTLHTDFFVDFGILGMVLCVMLVGAIFKKIDMTIYSPNKLKFSPWVIVLCISLGASSLYLSRAAFIPLLRAPIYAYIIMRINTIVCHKS